jgi:cytidyltransferase-like protein
MIKYHYSKKNMTETSKQYSVGMVFGVFDGLHQGHHHFLSEAQKNCTTLVIVVAHPKIVEALKQHSPLHSLETRVQTIQNAFPQATVISGDTNIGTWSALKKYHPDIVFLGYDQERLGQELEKIGMHSTVITAHSPEKYKSSLLNRKTTIDS